MKALRNNPSTADAEIGMGEVNNGKSFVPEQAESRLISDSDIVIEDGFLVLRAKEPSDAVSSILEDREDRMAFLSQTDTR